MDTGDLVHVSGRTRNHFSESTPRNSRTQYLRIGEHYDTDLPTPRTATRSDRDKQQSSSSVRTPSKSLLQERLTERKAVRRLSIDTAGETQKIDRSTASSPGPDRSRHATEKTAPASSTTQTTMMASMGAKEMENALSTLHKQNFDLKLELHYRRDRQSGLEAKLEAAEAQVNEQRELLSVNEELLAELEKRDQAVEEAVSIICSLEEKVERLMRERETVRIFDSQPKSTERIRKDYTVLDDQSPSSTSNSGSLPKARRKAPVVKVNLKEIDKGIKRMPSFLSEKNQGADNLRSLYLTKKESETPEPFRGSVDPEDLSIQGEMNSPRLSLLSESSFLSVYGRKPSNMDPSELNNALPSPTQNRRLRNIFVTSNDQLNSVGITPNTKPSQTTRSQATVPSKATTGYVRPHTSLNKNVESPLQRLEKLHQSLDRSDDSAPSRQTLITNQSTKTTYIGRPGHLECQKSRDGHRLPPTPDTIGTSTLRRLRKSNESLSRSFQNSEISTPPSQEHSGFQTVSSGTRTSSSCQTTVSRRNVQGWATANSDVSLSTIDDNDDHNDTASSIDPWLATADEGDRLKLRDPAQDMFSKQKQALEPPDMFSFSALDAEDDFEDPLDFGPDGAEDWDNEMILNRSTSIDVPSMASKLQKLGVDEVAINAQHRAFSFGSSNATTKTPSSTQPAPPKRSSSLGKKARNDKYRPLSARISESQLPSTPPTHQRIRDRLSSKLFGRTESHSLRSSSTPRTPLYQSAKTSTTPNESTAGSSGTDRIESSTPTHRGQKTQQIISRSYTYSDATPNTQTQARQSTSGKRPPNITVSTTTDYSQRRSSGSDIESEPSQSATPPPIPRYPTYGGSGGRRPNSSSVPDGPGGWIGDIGIANKLLGSRGRRESTGASGTAGGNLGVGDLIRETGETGRSGCVWGELGRNGSVNRR